MIGLCATGFLLFLSKLSSEISDFCKSNIKICIDNPVSRFYERISMSFSLGNLTGAISNYSRQAIQKLDFSTTAATEKLHAFRTTFAGALNNTMQLCKETYTHYMPIVIEKTTDTLGALKPTLENALHSAKERTDAARHYALSGSMLGAGVGAPVGFFVGGIGGAIRDSLQGVRAAPSWSNSIISGTKGFIFGATKGAFEGLYTGASVGAVTGGLGGALFGAVLGDHAYTVANNIYGKLDSLTQK